MTSFIEEYLPLLPDHIVLNIIAQLPPEHVTDVLLRLESPGGRAVRKIITDEYYSKELHFIVAPTRRPYYSAFPLEKRPFITFKSVFDIKSFLRAHTDINPRKLVLVSGGDFASLRDLMESNRSRFTDKIGHLDVTIESGGDRPIAGADLEFLLLFPNLRKLHCSSKLTQCRRVLHDVFKNHEALEEIVLLGHGISNWSHVAFPHTKLRLLDISWTQLIDVRTIAVPQSTREIYWNMASISDPIMTQLHFPANLTTLMLTYNKIQTLDVAQFPRTLENLDLSNNQLASVVDSTGQGWPPALRSLLLTLTHINNDLMLALSTIGWPSALKNLVLDNNPFTKVHLLFGLPLHLSFLNLANTQITSFIDDHGELYSFPAYLRMLRLANCSELTYSTTRVKFPSTISELDLSECNISTLEVVEFPHAIEKLALLGNKITDLTSYGLPWTLLDSLTELDLFSNRIASLTGWVPPHALHRLDLRLNRFTTVSPESMSLFDERFHHPCRLTYLNLSQNSISDIDPRILVPPSLRVLVLSENTLDDVLHVPTSLAHHPRLRSLDLSGNYILQIEVPENPHGRSALRYLNLSGNLLFKGREPAKVREEVPQFYNTLERGFGVVVKSRKFNVNVQHTFVA